MPSPLVVLLLLPLFCCGAALARPARTVPYFPHHNPWDAGDIGIHAEESRWHPYTFPSEDLDFSKYLYSFDESDKQLRGRPSVRQDIQPSIPVYERGKGGFVPPSLSALDKVYWWDKRFNNFDVPPAEDLPFFDDDAEDYNDVIPGGTKRKRDYTAAQLVNVLKALAKARRQRRIRIAGKGLRFGISR